MIVFTEPGGSSLAPALCEALGRPEAPSVLVDLVALRRTGPESLGRAWNRTVAALNALVDAHEESGVRRYVVVTPADLLDRVPELAFWIRRRAAQRCFRLDGPGSSKSSADWARAAASRLLVGEGSAVDPWEPEPPRLETPRLVLTWPTREQSEGFYRAIIGTTMFDTLLWDGPSSPEDMHDFALNARRQWAMGPSRHASFAIIERASDRQIGGCSWRPNPADPEKGDIGYALAPAWHGRGYGTEAIGALVDFAFGERRARRVTADVFTGNAASRRLLEKLGFRLEGITRGAQLKRGAPRDEWLMSLIRADWEARRRA